MSFDFRLCKTYSLLRWLHSNTPASHALSEGPCYQASKSRVVVRNASLAYVAHAFGSIILEIYNSSRSGHFPSNNKFHRLPCWQLTSFSPTSPSFLSIEVSPHVPGQAHTMKSLTLGEHIRKQSSKIKDTLFCRLRNSLKVK